METLFDISKVKPGDKFYSSRYSGSYSIYTVSKITEKRKDVVMESGERFDNIGMRMINGCDREWIHPLTPEVQIKIERVTHRKELLNTIGNCSYSKMSIENLESIVAIIKKHDLESNPNGTI